jgi:tetraacyldisaccharide 4'-kinase
MAKSKIVNTCILLPISKLYGFGMSVRNIMFKWHILKQRKFNVPVVVVGNIAVGGTGKTPHTEYVINLLKYSYHIGVISRGYKRKTKGFVLATSRSNPLDIGDEPYQIYQKFGREISVAVCENRCEGIDELLKIDPKINMIVLDDAFQHRYVDPTISIVLTEFNRPIFMDKLLPLGRLREPMSAVYRADIVVVTKCPEQLKPLEYRIFQNNLKLYPYQKLFFSRYEYAPLRPVFPEEVSEVPNLRWMTGSDSILIVSGIANPRPLVKQIKRFEPLVKIKIFPDHHNFTRKDLDAIERRYDQMEGDNKIIVTSEKDAVRLANNPYFPQRLKAVTFYQPINVTFDGRTPENFDTELKKMIQERTIY